MELTEPLSMILRKKKKKKKEKKRETRGGGDMPVEILLLLYPRINQHVRGGRSYDNGDIDTLLLWE